MPYTSKTNLEVLLAAYRHEGDIAAAQEILTRFEGLIGKYLKLLTRGEYDPTDDDICRFLTMLGKSNLARTADVLALRLKRFERADLRQECVLAMLEAAMYCTYVSGGYKFKLLDRVLAMLRQDLPEVPLTETMTPEDLFGQYAPIEAPDVEIDSDWVKGDTAELFGCLTVEERQLVKLVWQDKVPTEEICVQLGISPSTLQKRKKAIREKLAQHLRLVPKK